MKAGIDGKKSGGVCFALALHTHSDFIARSTKFYIYPRNVSKICIFVLGNHTSFS
jgi:hypothetical protein